MWLKGLFTRECIKAAVKCWCLLTDWWGAAPGRQSRCDVRTHWPVPHCHLHAAEAYLQHTPGWWPAGQEGHHQALQLHHREHAVCESVLYGHVFTSRMSSSDHNMSTNRPTLLVVLNGVPGQRGVYGCAEGPDARPDHTDSWCQSGRHRRWTAADQISQPAGDQSPGDVWWDKHD